MLLLLPFIRSLLFTTTPTDVPYNTLLSFERLSAVGKIWKVNMIGTSPYINNVYSV